MRFPADVAEFPADWSEVMNQLKGISNETAQRKAQASPLMFDGTTRAPHMCCYAVHIQLWPGENPELLQRLVAIHREGPTIVGSCKVCSTVPAKASCFHMLKQGPCRSWTGTIW